MMVYHCMNAECGATFRMERARICPCCGGTMLRHALSREIDELDSQPRETVRWLPVNLAPETAGDLAS